MLAVSKTFSALDVLELARCGQRAFGENYVQEALEKIDRSGPFDLTLLDLHLPDVKGFEGLKSMRAKRPECPVVVLSGELDAPTILHCIELGAAGYIPKSLHTDAVMNALRLIAAGDIYIPHQAVAAGRIAAGGLAARHAGAGSDPRDLGLTDRQVDVLRLILKGLPNKLICRRLNLAEGTIKVHVSAVLRALGVRNRTQAIIAAGELGLRLPELDGG